MAIGHDENVKRFFGSVVRRLVKRFFEEKFADARQKAQQD